MASSVGERYENTKRVALNATLTVLSQEFSPKRIIVHNLTNDCRAEWNDGLPDGYAILTVAAGDRTLVTTAGFTPVAGTSTTPPGFSLGALANINDTTTESLLFEMWG